MYIGISCFLAGIALAVSGSLTFWKVLEGIDFYKPLILFLAGYIGLLFLWWVVMDIYGRVLCLKSDYKKVNKVSRLFLTDSMRFIDNHALAMVKVHGKNKIPTGQRFLFVQNHTAKFDPMIANAYLPKHDIAFITKPSNFKIPVAKRLMPSLFYQAIIREDPIQSLGVMKNSIDLITKNITSIGVYPEGTRHQDNELGEFHEGVFNICLKAKCPLVVSTLTNSYKIHKNFPFKVTKVDFDIVEVIPYEQMENMTAKALSDMVRNIMLTHLKEKALA